MAIFKYYNNNINGKQEKDCVTRAITLAFNTNYLEVAKNLEIASKQCNCEKLNINCYKVLIEKFYNGKPLRNVYGLKIKDFIKTHNVGVFLIRVKGHLTTIINGVIYDTWNCSNEIITNAWRCF